MTLMLYIMRTFTWFILLHYLLLKLFSSGKTLSYIPCAMKKENIHIM